MTTEVEIIQQLNELDGYTYRSDQCDYKEALSRLDDDELHIKTDKQGFQYLLKQIRKLLKENFNILTVSTIQRMKGDISMLQWYIENE